MDDPARGLDGSRVLASLMTVLQYLGSRTLISPILDNRNTTPENRKRARRYACYGFERELFHTLSHSKVFYPSITVTSVTRQGKSRRCMAILDVTVCYGFRLRDVAVAGARSLDLSLLFYR